MDLFEDFADEYLWRPAMFLDKPEYDRNNNGHRFTYE